MSAFHYRAELLERDETRLTYRFFPEFVDQAECWGEFNVDCDSGAFEITRPSGIGTRSGIPVDEKCVRALIHKLRSSSEAAPESIHFVA